MPLKDAATLTGLTQGQLLSSTLFSTKTDPEGDSKGVQLINPKGYPFAKDLGYFDLAAQLRGRPKKAKKASKKKIDLRSIDDRSMVDLGSINSAVDAEALKSEKPEETVAPPYSINILSTSNSVSTSKKELVTNNYAGANGQVPSWAQNLQFPLVTGETWTLTEEVLTNLRRLHKESEIILNCKKAVAWLHANPKRRKTKIGMSNFLLSWMNRATPEPQNVKSTGGFRAGGLL